MISALVQFSLANPMPADKMAEVSEANAPLYEGMPGLVRKYYVSTDGGSSVGGIYLWEDRASAEACWNDAWRERVTGAYGSEPTITWFDCPVVLDNRHGELVT